TRYSEDELMVAVEAGAEDISTDEDVFEVITEPADFTAVRTALEGAGVQIESAEVVYRPSSLGPIDEGQAGRPSGPGDGPGGKRRRRCGSRQLRRPGRGARARGGLTGWTARRS